LIIEGSSKYNITNEKNIEVHASSKEGFRAYLKMMKGERISIKLDVPVCIPI
jgi:hypothetical protein